MDDLIAVMMPGLGSSEKIQTNAEIILKELGIKYRNISIKEAVISHFKDIGHAPNVYDTIRGEESRPGWDYPCSFQGAVTLAFLEADDRSEERRVGKECRSRWSPYH